MSSRLQDFRSVAKSVGAVVMGIGAGIALCAAVGATWDLISPDPTRPQGHEYALPFSALLVFVTGLALFMYGRKFSTEKFSRRDAILAVSLIWVAASVGGALPFYFGTDDMSMIDSFFEAVSGLTTTGATVITNIESSLTRPLLLWRSAIQWLGGMGIVVLFVAIFPNVGAGGKRMFRGEVPGATSEGLKPRIAETSFTLWKLYAAFTILELSILALLGMNFFDALCHSLTTMSTGGFSTLDGSIGGFNNPAFEYVIACFMLVGSVNYGLYYAAMRGRTWRVIVRSIEFKAFVAIVISSVLALTFLNLPIHNGILVSFRKALFTVATTISSTGYGADDYTAFGPPAFTIMVLLMFVGGCSGSTAGGIKIERAVLLGKQAAAQIRKSFRPSAVQLVRMGKTVVNNQVLADVTAFFVIYMGCVAVGLLFITWVEGIPLETAFGAILTCLSNMGPAPFHEVADHFAHYSAGSKLFFCVAMLLGRLEFFTLFALMLPSFWRR